jgi:hypothetical protein
MDEKFVSIYPIELIYIKPMVIEEILVIDQIEVEKNDQKWQIDGKESNENLMNYPLIDKDQIEMIKDDVNYFLFSFKINKQMPFLF